MTRPRHHLFPENTPLHVHCVQRCVRRAFLCGEDALTGRSFEHRRAWLEQRIHLLAECFALAMHAYAVMSSHLHLVLSIEPAAVETWSDEDIARRWCRLFPPLGHVVIGDLAAVKFTECPSFTRLRDASLEHGTISDYPGHFGISGLTKPNLAMGAILHSRVYIPEVPYQSRLPASPPIFSGLLRGRYT